MILVGITWPDGDYSVRYQEFYEQADGSGAPQFLGAIKEEMIPLVEATYRCLPDDRTIVGSSAGGTFGLYAIYNEPALFKRCVVTSPGTELLTVEAQAFVQRHRALPVQLSIAVGEREEYYDQPLVDFAKLMSSADLEGLAMETRVVAGAGHASTVMEGYTRGYMFVFGTEP